MFTTIEFDSCILKLTSILLELESINSYSVKYNSERVNLAGIVNVIWSKMSSVEIVGSSPKLFLIINLLFIILILLGDESKILLPE